MQREHLSLFPDGTGVMFTQELRETGWYNLRARSATPQELMSSTSTPAKSGSSNDHARLAPSASATWTTCTRSISYAAENEDRIFRSKLAKATRLIPYLETFKDELHPEELRAIPLLKKIARGKVAIEDLTPEQRKDILKTEGSEYSREGTRAHDFASDIFKGHKTIEDIPEEFRIPVNYYIQHCLALVPAKATPIIERSVDLFYSKKDSGTVDFAVVTLRRIIVRDLKYGMGDLVEARENTQLATYALSLVEEFDEDMEFDPDTIVDIGIVQPRHHEAEPFRTWEVTLKDLRDFCRDIHYSAIQVQEGRGLQFVPSDKACRWCDCNAFCVARAEAETAAITGPDRSGFDVLAHFEDLDKAEKKAAPYDRACMVLDKTGAAAVLDDETMVALYARVKGIKGWLEDIEEHLEGRVLAGEEIEGLKVVIGREGDRKWIDEDAAEKMLANRLKSKEQRTVTKVISPAEAEKRIDLENETTKFKNLFDACITRSAGQRKMALATDKREAVGATVHQFEALDDEDDEDVERSLE